MRSQLIAMASKDKRTIDLKRGSNVSQVNSGFRTRFKLWFCSTLWRYCKYRQQEAGASRQVVNPKGKRLQLEPYKEEEQAESNPPKS
jgi:hypothetical protein